jgi:EmrB/QacA subfamily drug resistance transporter
MTQSLASQAGGAGALRFSSARGRWVIAATVLGSGIAIIDGTVVGIALPTIGRDFHASLGSLQWVTTGYTLTLAAFLLLGGSLGDRFGRRRIFMVGIAWFAIASGLCGIAPNAPVLIVMRTLQGVGGALLTPGSLAILEASFSTEDRSRAIGAWSGLGGVATAVGPLLGGYLISAATWRLIFYINVPLAVAVLIVSARHVPESRDPSAGGHIDLPGAALGALLLGGLNFVLIEGSSVGWQSATVLVAAAITVVAGVAFFWVELSVPSPMLPLGIFKSRQFSATNAVTFAVYGALGGALFLLPIMLQVVSHYTPLQAGLALLPVTLIMLLFSARSGRLATQIGPRLQMSVGPLVVAVGLALLARAPNGTGYAEYVLPAMVVFGAGLAITVAPLTATAMSSAPAARSGIASAVNNDVARVAGLVAVALLPWLSGIPGSAHLQSSALAGAFKTAMFICAGLCVTGGIVAAVGIRNPQRMAVKKVPRMPVGPSLHAAEQFACALDAPALDCGPRVGAARSAAARGPMSTGSGESR